MGGLKGIKWMDGGEGWVEVRIIKLSWILSF